MRLFDILVAPRFASSGSAHWWLVGLHGLFVAGAIACGIAISGARGQQLALVIYAFGAAMLAMWLAALLLVARDGRRLGLPGVTRNSAWATCTYVLAIVAAPALLIGALGGDVTMAILFPALAMSASMAYVLLPLVIASWLGVLPAVYIGLHNAFHVPSPFDPRFQHWAWLALAILAVVDVIRWRQILRGDGDDDSIWRKTMLVQMRGNLFGKWGSIDQRWAWRCSGNKPTAVDFRSVASGNPAKAIEVSLGGWYLPQTLGSRLSSLARVILPMLLFIPLMWLMNIGREQTLHKVWTIIGVSGGLWVGLFGGAMLSLMTAALLQRRWKHHSGMALLALLPGIDGGQPARHLVRAVFIKPAITFTVLWLCMLVPALVLRSGPMALLLSTLLMGGMAALMFAAVLMLMAGRPMRTFTKVVLFILVLVLINVSAIVGVVTPITKLGSWGQYAQWLAALAWLALIAWATWRSGKAWRALQSRPHPFLANPPQ